MSASNIFFSLAAGVLPALLWLWFWLKEDRLHPEPRRLIMLTFFAGMAVVGIALPLEQITHYVFKRLDIAAALGGFLMLFFWALAEEFSKYFAAKKAALSKREFDEPIDAMVYLITAALGFAALENVIFLVDIVNGYGLSAGLMTSNLRFAGATLVHLLSSAIVGSSIAFCFFHKEKYRRNVFWGIALATLLHAFFNYFIIKSSGKDMLQVLLPFWFLILVLLFVFKKVKRIKRIN